MGNFVNKHGIDLICAQYSDVSTLGLRQTYLCQILFLLQVTIFLVWHYVIRYFFHKLLVTGIVENRFNPIPLVATQYPPFALYVMLVS